MADTIDRLRQVDVPEGQSGDWKVSRFKATEQAVAFFNLREMVRSKRYMKPGTYTELTHCGSIVMSDTPAEMVDHQDMIRRVHGGHVLITGLGLGVVIQAVLDEPNVEHLTVVELSEDVISLVAPHWQGRYNGRLTVIQADALEWTPPRGSHYSIVWHDIWPNICGDNLGNMRRLHRKYQRRCDWQGSWCQAECRRLNGRGSER